MSQSGSDADEFRLRQKFVRLSQNFDANTRFRAPYVQFAGKPLAFLADPGGRYDGLGCFNTVYAEARPTSETLRVFLVGDSTPLEGQVFADAVPGLLETALKQIHGEGPRVYNFGAISACLN